MRLYRILAFLIIPLLFGCSRDFVPLLGQDQTFCDELYGTPEKILDVKTGTTRIYSSKGMVISVSISNQLVSGCAYKHPIELSIIMTVSYLSIWWKLPHKYLTTNLKTGTASNHRVELTGDNAQGYAWRTEVSSPETFDAEKKLIPLK